MRRTFIPLAGALLLTGCELQEVAIADAEPFVVVESYLSAGLPALVALHASVGADELLEADAIVELVAEDTTLTLERVDIDRCLSVAYDYDPNDFPGGLACYAQARPDTIVPDSWLTEAGVRYRLDVTLPDGSTLSGATRVPQPVAFALDDDEAPDGCFLPPWTQAELVWNAAEGAAAYILDLRVFGLRDALAAEGIDADIDDPFSLRGVSIGQADTSLVLPAQIGVFDRFDIDADAALALQRGLPPGTRFTVVLVAVDRNYVDWVRGGDFNPSGPLRTPSLYGDAGTGVFGSMTLDVLEGDTDASRLPDDAPTCEMGSTS
ncbi:MAG TPA: hypothetical protein VF039_05845 [Longimicrobiales bacterium]